ncbi:MAG TPA: acyltransferase, partial [Polyangia bacterium]|nr:acyltransferase [Polyangia bacterium]
IPSLDGLRAISIAFVLVSHAAGTPNFPVEMLRIGELGVRVFFVISGFLITTLLLEEWRKTGTISIRDFYVRRVFRIFPAFYAFLACVLVLAALSIIHLQPFDALAAATYTMNYHPQRSWWVGHLWSLSVEEQFYLLWPLLLRITTPARGVWVAVAAVLAAPLIRVAVWVLLPASRVSIGESFPTICDALATGCVLACVRERLGQIPAYLRALRSPWFLLLPAAAVAVGLGTGGMVAINFAMAQTFCNVAIAISIDRWARFPEGLSGRVLNARPMVFVGVLSYSLYLWQQLFLNRFSTATVNAFPLNLVLAFAAALASHYLIEKPFLRLRSRRAAAARVPPQQQAAAAPAV